ncbi:MULTISPECIES: hypothetical protein [Streptomyces]|uniref:Uncharacterized protein n=1 Tax=Streptomyces ramulosus TaxID=47762 RepID=A0ABW1FSL3_9ACTN
MHAALFGLPEDRPPLPTALDELLQATYTARDGDQQQAVLDQLSDQLRNAAEILEWARNHANWRSLPPDTWEWLRDATDTARLLADGLDSISPTFATPVPSASNTNANANAPSQPSAAPSPLPPGPSASPGLAACRR